MGTTSKRQAWILDQVLKLIRKARKKIFLASFLFNHEAVEKALVDAAKRLQGGVYVITVVDKNLQRRVGYQEDPDDVMQVELERLKKLSQEGVYIRHHPNCHAKFLVVDDEVAMITSANIRDTSLEHNPELGFVFKERKEVDRLSHLFQHLWINETEKELVPHKISPRTLDIQNVDRKPFPEALEPAKGEGLIWTCGPNQTSLQQVLIDVIEAAQDNIICSTYNLKALFSEEGDPVLPIAEALTDALGKGINVEILRHVADSQRGQLLPPGELNTIKALTSCVEAGQLSVFGHPFLHMKYVVADSSQAVFFTANLDGGFGLDSGVDVGWWTDDRKLIDGLQKLHVALKVDCPLVLDWQPDLTTLTKPREALRLPTDHFIVKGENKKDAMAKFELLEQLLNAGCLCWTQTKGTLLGKPLNIIHTSRYSLTAPDSGYHLHSHAGAFNVTQSPDGWRLTEIETDWPMLKDERDERPAPIQGWLPSGEWSIVIHWPHTIQEIAYRLQSYLDDNLGKKKPSITILKLQNVKEFKELADAGELPFDNTIEGWLTLQGLIEDYEVSELDDGEIAFTRI